MKVTGYEVFSVANPDPSVGGPVWVFLRLDTDAGVSGYGEVFTSAVFCPPAVLAKVIGAVVEGFVLGSDPRAIEALYHRVYNAHYSHSGDLTKAAVFSGIDIALWDILGKSLGVPVYDLLGGKFRDAIRMYTYLKPAAGEEDAGFWENPAAVGCRAAEMVDREGFTALKLDPVPLLTGGDTYASQPVPIEPTQELLRRAETIVGSVRDAVGDRADIMIGTHGQFTAAGAIRFARRLERFDPLWFEEPVPPELATEMARVASKVSIPIAAGERLSSKWEFARLAEVGAAAIFNFDVTQVGGLLESKKIAALAEAHGIQITPHIFGGPIAPAASQHLAVSCPNLLIMEGNGDYRDPAYIQLLDEPLDWRDGYLYPSDRPGLGHNLNEDLAREWAASSDAGFQYTRPPMHH
ncbi:MAG: mandelate racemase/muconate lactonizing enzyme family protein [Bifidobacteriaceae bacterium]|jgi:L-alanine-DL-glutamate epimerase-like enolase superfamily enzyme|nr:mandelate racemase/muconate lactonizing enzyme family protein [Bifidobacteriaceae bacterium]